MKIVFLNTYNCRITDPIHDFIIKHSQDTDIFCFQEVFKEAADLFEKWLPDYIGVSNNKYLSENNHYFITTYINKSSTLLSSDAPLLETTGTGFGIYTKIKVRGQDINICNVHGFSKPGHKLDNEKRLQQSKGLIAYHENIEGIKIIGGDFNLDINTSSVDAFEECGYRNLVKEFNIPTTRNKLAWDLYPDNKQLYADYVFVSKETKVSSFIVINNEISDHLPIILTVED